MKEALFDVEKQRENLIETQGRFVKVNDGILVSLQETLQIREQANICDSERIKITEFIKALRATLEESVSSTNQARESVTGLNHNIDEIESTSLLLKDYAQTLKAQAEYFSIVWN